MLTLINNNASAMLRALCLSAMLMAPVVGTALNHAAMGDGVSPGVGFALLVSLQRGATF